MRLQDIKVGDKFRSNKNGRVVLVTMIDFSPIRPIHINGEGWWTLSSFSNEFEPIDQSLSARVAELEAELAALKAEKAKPAYDYTNPKAGDLFRSQRGMIYMVSIFRGAVTLVNVSNNAGATWMGTSGFDGDEKDFTFLGKCNDNPNLLKESLP
jgi:hypothetical protein